jgi:EAL domain-containing protein (putative c-di-GMP-specific phosphodiesterase class I)
VCKTIGVRTIAEMVESEECKEKLRAVEVDYAQGFGIAKPLPF